MQKPYYLHGYNFYIKEAVAVKKTVKRTWKERLFSLNPLVATKDVTEYQELIEDDKFIYTNDSVFCNRKTFEKLLKTL